jgi:hypothetical protein
LFFSLNWSANFCSASPFLPVMACQKLIDTSPLPSRTLAAGAPSPPLDDVPLAVAEPQAAEVAATATSDSPITTRRRVVRTFLFLLLVVTRYLTAPAVNPRTSQR